MIRPGIPVLLAFALSLGACSTQPMAVSRDGGGGASGAGEVTGPGASGGTATQGTSAASGGATVTPASGGASGGDTTAPPITTSVGTAGASGGTSSSTPASANPGTGGQVVATGAGVVFVVTGAGGAELYPARQPRPAFVAALDDQHFSFTQVMITGNELRLRQVALGGQVLDETSWRKSAP